MQDMIFFIPKYFCGNNRPKCANQNCAERGNEKMRIIRAKAERKAAPFRIRRMYSWALACLLMSLPGGAAAQIGPDLRPPGLDPDIPLTSYAGDSNFMNRQLRQSWELNAGDVVFSAAKKRQLISEAPSTIHVITDSDIALHGRRSLAEILRHVPGIQTLATRSQFQSVMIRGLVGTEDNNSRILWLQNGVPMNDVRDSGIWIDETYPVELIKRIEVVLGPGSALYGSGAFQGVINIFTKDPTDVHPNGEYRLVMQNNLTFKASAIAAYESDDNFWGILGHASGNMTNGPGLIGDYAYVNYAMDEAGNTLSHNTSLQDKYRYKSIDASSQKYWYNVNFKVHVADLKWTLGFSDIYAQNDGSEYAPGIDYAEPSLSYDEMKTSRDESLQLKMSSHFDRREFYNDFVYDTQLADSLSFLAVLSYRFRQYQNRIDYANSANSSDSAKLTDINNQTFQHKLYGLAQFDWQIYENNSLIAGLVLEYQRIEADDFIKGNALITDGKFVVSSAIDATKLAHVTPSIFLQDEQRFWNNRIILTAGARFDAYRIYLDDEYPPDYAPSWRFSFLAKWTDWMNMRLSYGYAFKAPSLYQLYIYSDTHVGNARLKPETLHNAELSFLFSPIYAMKIRAGGFITFMKNVIIMQQDNGVRTKSGTNGAITPKQDNSEATIGGFELSFDYAINPQWNVYAFYDFLYSHRDYDLSSGGENASETIDRHLVPYDAKHRAKFGASYMTDAIRADLAFFLVGGYPESESEDRRKSWKTPFYAIAQPQITIALPANLGLMLSGSYAFSEGMTKSPTYRYYYEREGIPVSRYSISASLQYPFKN